MEQLLDTGEVGRPRRDADEPRLIGEEQAEALIAQAREHGVELLGEQGLLRQMTKAVLERALTEELTDHLGDEVGDPAGNGQGNRMNGHTAQRLRTEPGTVDLEVPRERAGSFEPKIVAKGQRRLDGIDKIVIGLYAHGMTVRDVQQHLLDDGHTARRDVSGRRSRVSAGDARPPAPSPWAALIPADVRGTNGRSVGSGALRSGRARRRTVRR
jgi:putative transposase